MAKIKGGGSVSKYRIIQLDSAGSWGNIISDEVLTFETDDEARRYAYDSLLHWRNAIDIQCAEPWDDKLVNKLYYMKNAGFIHSVYHKKEEIRIWETDWEYDDPIVILSNQRLSEYIQTTMTSEIENWKDVFSIEEIKSWFDGAKVPWGY